MWNDVGIMRDAGGIENGLRQLEEYESALMQTGVADDNRAFNLTWHDWLNMRSLVTISKVIAMAAAARKTAAAHISVKISLLPVILKLPAIREWHEAVTGLASVLSLSPSVLSNRAKA